MRNGSLTQEFLKECLIYDPESGIFTWKRRPREHFKTTGSWKIWNIRFCGKEAGNKARGYIEISFYGKSKMAHRLAFLYMTGEWPKNGVDHINHTRDDNRWQNLRKATQIDNNRNESFSKNNTSGFTGVYFSRENKKWIANISVNFKTLYLGSFIEKADAIERRKAANIKYDFHENHGK